MSGIGFRSNRNQYAVDVALAFKVRASSAERAMRIARTHLEDECGFTRQQIIRVGVTPLPDAKRKYTGRKK